MQALRRQPFVSSTSKSLSLHMIRLEEALEIVLREAISSGTERVPFRESAGRALAEEIRSDLDMPPFDKSAVDGFACRREDLGTPLSVIGTIPAGSGADQPVTSGTCFRIMTGAPVPPGADCVIMVEESKEISPDHIRFTGEWKTSNICLRGEDIRRGDVVLIPGTLIRPQDIAVLASTGHIHPLVALKPRVAVISTGDELVEPSVQPAGATIRDSNSYQLEAQILRAGAWPLHAGIVRDHPETLRKAIDKALSDCDILLLSGGVSMGDFDHVPAILEEAGIRLHFRTIAIQPGKPTVFGTRDKKYIFGLPGNPVSSFVLFELLVHPLIRKIMGGNPNGPVWQMRLGADFRRRKSERQALIPVRILNGEIHPVEYHGSAHINAYTHADGIISMEIGVNEMKKGSYTDVRPV